nr:unnamed protein product [Spirometra erinaceieuropaei]
MIKNSSLRSTGRRDAAKNVLLERGCCNYALTIPIQFVDRANSVRNIRQNPPPRQSVNNARNARRCTRSLLCGPIAAQLRIQLVAVFLVSIFPRLLHLAELVPNVQQVVERREPVHGMPILFVNLARKEHGPPPNLQWTHANPAQFVNQFIWKCDSVLAPRILSVVRFTTRTVRRQSWTSTTQPKLR